jgi:hypothetical protein
VVPPTQPFAATPDPSAAAWSASGHAGSSSSGGIPKGLLIGGIAAALVVVLLAAGLAVVFLGGGSDGTTPPPDLADVAIGSDPDESAFCTVFEQLDQQPFEASPGTWAAGLRRLAAHAYDEGSEAWADANRLSFRWTVDGQRSQDLFDEIQDANQRVPGELCGKQLGGTIDELPESYEQLQEGSEQLADDQGLPQPGNRFFLYFGTVTVVFTDITEDEGIAACEAWGDEPYEILADDGIIVFGQSNDQIDVLQDPVVIRNGIDGSCEVLEPSSDPRVA